MLKVASRVQKIEVFIKGWNFASCSCLFASLQVALWKKNFSWRKETTLFSYFHNEIIFCCTELFECAFNFKFSWNIFIFLIINTNQTSKEQDLNFIESATYFGSRHRECPGSLCLEVNFQTCNFTLQAFLRILVTSFWPALKRLIKF